MNSVSQAENQNKPSEAGPGNKLVPLAPSSQSEKTEKSKPIDLLSGIDLNKDVVQGNWKRDGKRLITKGSAKKTGSIRLQEVQIPEEYDVNLRIERLGNSGGLDLVFMMSGHQTILVMEKQAWWIEAVDGKFDHTSPTRKNIVTEPGEKFDARLEVRKDGFAVYRNDEEVFSWKGKAERLSTGDFWPPLIPENDSLFLLTNGAFAVDKIELNPKFDS